MNSLEMEVERKRNFDELFEDQRLTEPKSRFEVRAFYPVTDTILSHLDNIFRVMRTV